jgi:hypothetical protein
MHHPTTSESLESVSQESVAEFTFRTTTRPVVSYAYPVGYREASLSTDCSASLRTGTGSGQTDENRNAEVRSLCRLLGRPLSPLY